MVHSVALLQKLINREIIIWVQMYFSKKATLHLPLLQDDISSNLKTANVLLPIIYDYLQTY